MFSSDMGSYKGLCYDFEQYVRVKPVLVFGTEQNSYCQQLLSKSNVPKIKQFDELSKECHLTSGIVLGSLRVRVD
jgi:hypothetical protein